jgi:hypothetical protein
LKRVRFFFLDGKMLRERFIVTCFLENHAQSSSYHSSTSILFTKSKFVTVNTYSFASNFSLKAWYRRYHVSTSNQPPLQPAPPNTDSSSRSSGGIRGTTVVFWRRLATAVKYVRIPFLVLSVFGLGYNQGLLDYARDPEAKERYLLDTALAGVAATSQNIIQDRFDNRYQQVQRVGN